MFEISQDLATLSAWRNSFGALRPPAQDDSLRFDAVFLLKSGNWCPNW